VKQLLSSVVLEVDIQNFERDIKRRKEGGRKQCEETETCDWQ
jgi:hypothetical protein